MASAETLSPVPFPLPLTLFPRAVNAVDVLLSFMSAANMDTR